MDIIAGSKIIIKHANGYVIEASIDNVYDNELNRVNTLLPKNTYVTFVGYASPHTKGYDELLKKLYQNNREIT